VRPEPSTLADDTSLTESLRAAVPLALLWLHRQPASDRQHTAHIWAIDAAQRVGEAGDLLQFTNGRGRSGRVANVFNHLAKGLAAAAVLNPTGVDFAGLHWCTNPDCDRCPTPNRQRPDVRAIDAELERLDADYRRLAGIPPHVGATP
jgi:hypothetical protein